MDPQALLGFGLLGLAGFLHCAGMCGGFALAIASPGQPSHGLRLGRTLLFGFGKATTYVILGLLLRAGLEAAMGPEHRPWNLHTARRAAAVLAGLILILHGLAWTGLLPRPRIGSKGPLQRALRLVRLPLSRAGSAARSLGGPAGAFSAGLVTGFLPCGHSLVAFALATQTDPATAALGLFLFGLATTPALATIALGAGLLAPQRHARVQRSVGVAVIAFGILTMTRGGMHHSTGMGDMHPTGEEGAHAHSVERVEEP